MVKASDSSFIYRLTALWALCESGLGGIMHALQIPFTGFFVGGFAVLIIGLIAFYTTEIYSRKMVTQHILQATLLVCLVKAAVSPQSPIGAYIAIGFQGLIGSLLYRLPIFKITSIVFGIIALLESAFQKLLMLTIVFGKSFWQAVDIFFSGLLKDLALPENFSFSFWLILIYSTVYGLWGFLLGLWIGRLPLQIETRSADVLIQFQQLNIAQSLPNSRRPNRFKKLFIILFILAFIVAVLLFSGNVINEALYVMLRTIAVLLILFYLAQPFVKGLFSRLLKSQSNKHKQKVEALINILPDIKSFINPAYIIASRRFAGLKKYKEFILVLFILSLHQLKSSE